MRFRDLHYLQDILISARLALSYVSGHTWTRFLQDTQLQDSVLRRLEIMGKAERRLSEETRIHLSNIPFTLMRNRIFLEYDKVDLSDVWDVVHKDLPRLIAQLEKVVLSHEKL